MFKKKDEISSKCRPSPFKSLFTITKREAKANKPELKKIRRVYAKERTKQLEHMKNEVTYINKLLEEGSIDENTYARYKKLLEMVYVEKRQETREKYGFTNLC